MKNEKWEIRNGKWEMRNENRVMNQRKKDFFNELSS